MNPFLLGSCFVLSCLPFPSPDPQMIWLLMYILFHVCLQENIHIVTEWMTNEISATKIRWANYLSFGCTWLSYIQTLWRKRCPDVSYIQTLWMKRCPGIVIFKPFEGRDALVWVIFKKRENILMFTSTWYIYYIYFCTCRKLPWYNYIMVDLALQTNYLSCRTKYYCDLILRA